MTTAGGGVVIGLLGAGVVYLLAKGKAKSDELAELEQVQPGPPGREGRPPRLGPPPSSPGAPPQVAPQGDGSLPPPQASPYPHYFPHGYPPRQAPGPQYGPPSYPPPRSSAPAHPQPYPHGAPPPMRHAGGRARIPGPPWVRATQADVRRDGAGNWLGGLLNSVRRPGYSEERTIGGRLWKIMVVSAAEHPELTGRVRDVIGWVMPGPARFAPPPPSLGHGAYPPYPSSSPVAYRPVPQVPYGGGAPLAPPQFHHAHHDPGSQSPMGFAPSPGGCQNWKPATDADVHQDGVATVYQSMLSLPETTPPRIEVHKGRTWKFQVVTPTSDPSFGFAPGIKKSVRGWICADAPRPDTSDPGY